MYRQIFGIAGVVGLALVAFGFGGWYFKVQRWQDELVRLQVDKEKKQIIFSSTIPKSMIAEL